MTVFVLGFYTKGRTAAGMQCVFATREAAEARRERFQAYSNREEPDRVWTVVEYPVQSE